MNRITLVAAIAAVACGLSTAEGANPFAEDETAIRQAVRSYVAAFNRGDARSVARQWSAEGVYVGPSGQRVQGREAIGREFAAYFAETTGQRIELGTPSIRFLTANVAVEEGVARVSRTGEPLAETSYAAIHVKQDGEWKLDSVRETVVPATPSHHEYLKQLEWMIGQWVDRDENSTINTVCAWTKNKNYITRSFSVSIEGRIEIEGTQIIGWDPRAKAIRSWMFDSEGGFGEARWSRDGNRWTVKTSRTLVGGERASAINVLTYVDANNFKWKSIGREIDGQLLPNIDEVTVVRKRSAN